MKKVILDTNIFLDDPDVLNYLPNDEILIPYEVIVELENLKTKVDIIGKLSRDSLKVIEKSISERITIGKPSQREGEKTDDTLIRLAKEEKALLISNDLAMRLKAKGCGVEATLLEERDISVEDRKEVSLTPEELDRIHEKKCIHLEGKFHPNQFIIANKALGRWEGNEMHLLNNNISAFGLSPKNKEQIYALNVLLDPKIPLVVLTGKAGCGKTLLGMAAGLEMFIEQNIYDSITLSRPIYPLGNDIGFLPGTKEEKMDPWIQPMKDNLLFLMRGNHQKMDYYFEKKGGIDIQVLSHIRGRTLPKKFLLVDEIQNASLEEIKAIVTRMGEGSKLVLTGDLQQVDANRVNKRTNGLYHLLTKMKNQKVCAHINFTKGERSELASIAAEIL